MRREVFVHLSARAAKCGWLAVAAAALIAGTPVRAQSPEARISELERRLEQSLQQIENLTRRLQQIEAQRPAAGAPSPAAEARTEPALDVTLPSASIAGGVPLHGFADVMVSRSSNPVRPGARSSFSLGTLDLYLTPQLSDRVKLLVELAMEYGQDQALAMDLERFQIGYTFNDALTAWVGRFHTPYGYWNTAFHHGAQIQTSILRPRFLEFEDRGGVLPSHTVGVLGTGTVRLGGTKLVYDAFAGNGARIANGTLEPNNIRADDANSAFGGKLGIQLGGALNGLTLGGHAYSAKVSSYDATDALLNRTRLRFYGGYLVYDERDWEVLAETYRFRNTDVANDAGSFNSNAYYVQIGKMIGWKTTPFARYEKAKLSDQDAYFTTQASGTSYTRMALGLRYDIDPIAALKVEYESTKEPSLAVPRSRRLLGQFAVRF